MCVCAYLNESPRRTTDQLKVFCTLVDKNPNMLYIVISVEISRVWISIGTHCTSNETVSIRSHVYVFTCHVADS